MIAELVGVLDSTGRLVDQLGPADVDAADRVHVLESVGRLQIDLAEFADRLIPRGGVNGTPQPSQPPTPPPPPPPPPTR